MREAYLEETYRKMSSGGNFFTAHTDELDADEIAPEEGNHAEPEGVALVSQAPIQYGQLSPNTLLPYASISICIHV